MDVITQPCWDIRKHGQRDYISSLRGLLKYAQVIDPETRYHLIDVIWCGFHVLLYFKRLVFIESTHEK